MPSEIREAHVRFIYVEWALMTVVGWMTMLDAGSLLVSYAQGRLGMLKCPSDILLYFFPPTHLTKNLKAASSRQLPILKIGPHMRRRQNPDWVCRVNTSNLRWPESFPKLKEDKHLWFLGGAPELQVVLLFKWMELTGGCVKGSV